MCIHIFNCVCARVFDCAHDVLSFVCQLMHKLPYPSFTRKLYIQCTNALIFISNTMKPERMKKKTTEAYEGKNDNTDEMHMKYK